MINTEPTTLVLGATGKTGSRVAGELAAHGLPVRTAARSKADMRFDWGERATYAPALAGVKQVYLVPPVMRTDFGPQVSAFLDDAESAGVRHVTFLSVYGTESVPPNQAVREVECDLLGRERFSHSILRPSWFMQNFSETFLMPVDGVIAVPTGSGAEAFIDADDIAAVAAATLTDPAAHSGAEYSLTGPTALTVSEAAAVISDVIHQRVAHVDPDREIWVAAMVASGVPAEYGAVLRGLTATIASGHGAHPNDVVESVTGRKPGSFADFARRAAAVWTTQDNR